MPLVKLVGILNVTPDSFSDGGECAHPEHAIARACEMAEEGADIIDIGAESTRPGAHPLTHAEEWQRLLPILMQLHNISVPVSVDTRHAETARKALDLGVSCINDVSGFASDGMIAAAKAYACDLVMMHSLTVPADKAITLPDTADVIEELLNFAHTRMGYMESEGIKRERIIFDPGIGFGKTAAQSQAIIERISELKVLGVPLYVGHSRKSFLGHVHGTNAKRDAATLEASCRLIEAGVDYLRVHNIKAHKLLAQQVGHVA